VRLAVRQFDIDTGAVLHKARNPALTKDGYPKLAHPGGQYALEVVLPQRQAVVKAGGEVTDVQRDAGKRLDLHGLTSGSAG